MKLRNKQTGEIGNLQPYGEDGRIWVWIDNISKPRYRYNSLAELNEEWEDYEEDELLYVVSAEHRSGYQCVLKEDYPEICKVAKELGIGFETEKECRKTVEKLKAWKRLKDKDYYFSGWKVDKLHIEIELRVKEYDFVTDELKHDMNLLFSQEDE